VASQWALEVVSEYMRLAMRIAKPERNPQFRTMARIARAQAADSRRARSTPMSASRVGTTRLQPIFERAGAELRAVHAVIRRELRAAARVAPLRAFASALRKNERRVAYHLWALRREPGTRTRGAASFFSLPNVGFGGYIVLAGELRGRGLLRAVIARIEEWIRRDRIEARGWFVECGPESAPIFLRVGFAESTSAISAAGPRAQRERQPRTLEPALQAVRCDAIAPPAAKRAVVGRRADPPLRLRGGTTASRRMLSRPRERTVTGRGRGAGRA